MQTKTASLRVAGGVVIDGTGTPKRRADVRIVGDRIEEVGLLKPRPGEQTLDARGLIVAPGFIDTHSHADGGLLQTPDASAHVRQGITTAIVGQDGGSQTPLATFFEQVRTKRVALNVASFVGHGTLRGQVLKNDYQREATPAEVARMAVLVEQEMRAGALGLSSGLEYDPGLYATTGEVIACAKVAAAHRGIYISHVRDEENGALAAFGEVICIAQEARLPAQISHIKLGSAPVWGKAKEVLGLIENANKRGLDISADVYPYTYWQSTITVIIPTRDWNDRQAWLKGLAEIGGARNVLLSTYTPDPSWAGRTIADLAAKTGKDPVTVIQEIVKNTHGPGAKGRESVVVTAMQEADLKAFLQNPRVMFCTDGGLRPSHPRGAGTYPRILGRYVREQRVLGLEAAVNKMTALPARRMGLKDRGVLRPGNKADLVVFDAARVRDTATTAVPAAAPIGIVHVLVNGVPVLRGGTLTNARPGRVLRRSLPGL